MTHQPQLAITTASTDDFFRRGRQVAQAADMGAPIALERLVSFDDPLEMLKLVTASRLALFRTVKETPGSITDLAARLHRDRSAVKRDLDELQRFGLVTIADTILPGHGRMKQVRATAARVRLTVEVQ